MPFIIFNLQIEDLFCNLLIVNFSPVIVICNAGLIKVRKPLYLL